jgi:hypothetical protein
MALSFKSPPLVTQSAIDQAAAALNVTLPGDYADFLLTVNGGVPKPRTLAIDSGEYKIERLYSLSATPPKKAAALVSELVPMNLNLRADGFPSEVLAIGLVDEQNILALFLQGAGVGTVSAWSTEISALSPRSIQLASSFSEFLQALEHPSEQALARAALQKQYDKFELAICDRNWAATRKLAAQLDLSHWQPVVHPVFSAIAERDLECIQLLHHLGISFVIADESHGGSPLRAAARRLQGDVDFLHSVRRKGDRAAIKKWETHVGQAQTVHSFLQDNQIA